VRWSYDTRPDGSEAEFHGDPLVTEGLVIAGSDVRQPEGIGHIYAFERATGKPRWKYRAGPGVTTDILRLGANIYAVTLQDELVSLDLETGEVVWTFATGHPNESFFMNSSPALSGERVFFGGQDGVVYALDAHSGGLLWKRDLGARISTSVAVSGDALYVGTTDRHLYRLSQKTGEVGADFAVEQADPPYGRLLIAGDSLFVFLGERTLLCMDLSLKKARWSRGSGGDWTSARPYLWRGAVLAGNELGELTGFRLADGTPEWSEKFEGVIRGVGASSETLYVGTLKGMLYAWSPGRVSGRSGRVTPLNGIASFAEIEHCAIPCDDLLGFSRDSAFEYSTGSPTRSPARSAPIATRSEPHSLPSRTPMPSPPAPAWPLS